jgi:hypothetical protein
MFDEAVVVIVLSNGSQIIGREGRSEANDLTDFISSAKYNCNYFVAKR